MDRTYLSLENINAYKISSELSDFVWKCVSLWDWFNKRTLGSQFVDSVDSIAANVAEGFGRFHKKDKQKFYYNARGSVYEGIHWTKRAYARKLFPKNDYEQILQQLELLPRELNWLISITEKKLKV